MKSVDLVKEIFEELEPPLYNGLDYRLVKARRLSDGSICLLKTLLSDKPEAGSVFNLKENSSP
ncbi:MAG: hypothetical protein R3D26_02140 [Cyanobacteriota/Melainabacteria group bacterium]